MKQNFSSLFQNGTGKSAGDELRKIQTDRSFSMKIIPADKIRTNPKNDYPIEDIQQLAESIKKTLIHPLNVVTIKDEVYDYELISGERRYAAIQYLLEQGDDTYKIGIPCKVENGDMLDAIDQEILLIEANELAREPDAGRRRKKIKRLQELYRQKMKSPLPKGSGEKKEIPIKEEKKLAEQAAAKNLGITERQVRKYNAVNEKLIPELQEIFDASGIPLNDAAVYANMDTSSQEIILQIIRQNEHLSKDKILHLQKELEEKEKVRLLEQEQLESSLQAATAENERMKQQIVERESMLKAQEAAYELEKQNLEKRIREETENAKPDTHVITSLNKEIEKLEALKTESEKENRDLHQTLARQQKEITQYKDKLKKLKAEKESSIHTLNQEKLEDEYELNRLYESIRENMETYKKKAKEYAKKHGTPPPVHESLHLD